MGIFRKWSLLAVVVTVESHNSLAPSNDKRARSRVPEKENYFSVDWSF